MSRIEELIQELCPEGVDYKSLGEVAEYRRGSFPQPYGNTNWYDGVDSMPFVQVADVGENMLLVPITKQRISKLAQPKSVFVPKDTVIVTLQGSIGRVAITQYDSYIDRTLGIFLKYKIDINKKYFAYQLQRKFGVEKEFARGSTIKTITKEEFTKFTIPIPPLPIQQEIVSILDKFTQLGTELEAELEERKKQYEYYRDQLLQADDEGMMKSGVKAEWKTLGDVTTLITKGTTPKSFKQNGVSFIKTEAFDGTHINKTKLSYIDEVTHETFLKRSILQTNDILFTIAGATIGKSAIVTEDVLPANTNQALAIIRLTTDINLNYIFYILRSNYMKAYITQKAKSSAQPNLNLRQLNDFPIPVPPLTEQNRIVEILDKFDTLVNDPKVGLPAEIAARRKQYEYYRAKLLDFKKL